MFLVSSQLLSEFLAVYFFEKLTFEELKEQLITKMIMKIPRLRQRIVHFMGDHYLIDVGVFEASKQIKLGQETLKNEQDICGFLNRNLTRRLDYNKPLWEIHFFPNFGTGNESVMI